jgi:peptidoglycan/LPS O-acetylase OafA/YrhL
VLGAVRFILALAVVFFHLAPDVFVFSGPTAVFGFYTVSGYLISKILTGTYRGRVGAFLLNRALRIYPAYWVVACFGFILAASGHHVANPVMAVPTDAAAWFRQLAIFGLLTPFSGEFHTRLVPPAWSLNMELVWYLAMIPLIRVHWWWTGGAVLVAAALIIRGDFFSAYFWYVSPALCFALGAAIGTTRLMPMPSRVHLLPALLILGVCLGLGNIVGWQVWLLYCSSMATAYVIYSSNMRLPDRWIAVDRWLGDLSYPVFLCHWHVASLFLMPLGAPLLWASIIPILITSAFIVLVVERPLRSIRSRVRGAPDLT